MIFNERSNSNWVTRKNSMGNSYYGVKLTKRQLEYAIKKAGLTTGKKGIKTGIFDENESRVAEYITEYDPTWLYTIDKSIFKDSIDSQGNFIGGIDGEEIKGAEGILNWVNNNISSMEGKKYINYILTEIGADKKESKLEKTGDKIELFLAANSSHGVDSLLTSLSKLKYRPKQTKVRDGKFGSIKIDISNLSGVIKDYNDRQKEVTQNIYNDEERAKIRKSIEDDEANKEPTEAQRHNREYRDMLDRLNRQVRSDKDFWMTTKEKSVHDYGESLDEGFNKDLARIFIEDYNLDEWNVRTEREDDDFYLNQNGPDYTPLKFQSDDYNWRTGKPSSEFEPGPAAPAPSRTMDQITKSAENHAKATGKSDKLDSINSYQVKSKSKEAYSEVLDNFKADTQSVYKKGAVRNAFIEFLKWKASNKLLEIEDKEEILNLSKSKNLDKKILSEFQAYLFNRKNGTYMGQ